MVFSTVAFRKLREAGLTEIKGAFWMRSDWMIVPPDPTTTKVPSPYVMSLRDAEVPEALGDHVTPSGELRMVPYIPTATKVQLAYPTP